MTEYKSRRGVYYDVSKSPYEYKTPYGDLFKFSSKKKLEIYSRDIEKELKRFDDLMTRNNLKNCFKPEFIETARRGVYKAFYRTVER